MFNGISKQEIKGLERLSITHWSALSWSTPPPSGTHTLRKRYSSWKKVQRRTAHWTTSNYDYRSITNATVNNLGWRTLELRRADARLVLFFKIVHGLVAVPLPDYIHPPHRISRHFHSLTFRQLHTTTNYYKYSFFPLAIVQWNALPADVACLPDLDSFKVAVSKLQHPRPLTQK